MDHRIHHFIILCFSFHSDALQIYALYHTKQKLNYVLNRNNDRIEKRQNNDNNRSEREETLIVVCKMK